MQICSLISTCDNIAVTKWQVRENVITVSVHNECFRIKCREVNEQDEVTSRIINGDSVLEL